MLIIEPVVLAPLREEWSEVRALATRTLDKGGGAPDKGTRTKALKAARRGVHEFLERLRLVKILDPACGSGNFLYFALRTLKNLEGEVIAFSSRHGLGDHIPFVSPAQLYGIEINPYAHQLAQVVVWIGHLQWAYQNAYANPDRPVLKKFDNIKQGDSILSEVDPSDPRPPWPEADYIIGNPPFLGGKLLRSQLGDAYVDALFMAYEGRVPREADLCCYWFERTRELINNRRVRRAGLLGDARNTGGVNHVALQRIKETGDIFFAESDRDWVLDGADVHVSMVGFDDGSQRTRILDGKAVTKIGTLGRHRVGRRRRRARPNRDRAGSVGRAGDPTPSAARHWPCEAPRETLICCTRGRAR